MPYYYAQINGSNIVHTVCALSGPVVAANMIAIASMDAVQLGATYDPETETFTPPAP